MQGSLRVLPSDCGLALRFTLPVTPACEEDIAPRHLQRQEPLLPELQGRGRRLWLADDSPVMREVLVAELSGLGFEVTVLAEGHQALDQLRTIGIEPPDLLLTDLRMPGVDGITLLRSARARWPGLPVVLLTSAPELISGQHDFSALLTKPVSLAELRTTLASLLDLELGAALVPGNSA
jgi:CheY-like chemotaxis protein